MGNDAVRQYSVHCRFHRTPQNFAIHQRSLPGRVDALFNQTVGFAEAHGQKNLFLRRMCEPLSGGFDPQHPIQLEGRVARCRLDQQCVAAYIRREASQGAQF